MTVLAVNERVISVKDEDLESYIGSDTIYHCRATTPGADGTYAEYIVWDSIINGEKTAMINKSYLYDLSLTIKDTTAVPISTIVSSIEKYISSTYGAKVSFSISSATSSDDGTKDEYSVQDKLDAAMAVINSLNRLETKLVPAAEKIIDAELSSSLDDILDKVDTISSNVSILANRIS